MTYQGLEIRGNVAAPFPEKKWPAAEIKINNKFNIFLTIFFGGYWTFGQC